MKIVLWPKSKESFGMRRSVFISNFLFFSAFFIELLIVIVDKSAYTNPIEGRLFQITFVLFSLKVLCTEYSYKEWALILFMGIIGVISYMQTDRNEILRVVMFVAASKDISLQKAMKLTFFTTLIGVVGLILLSITGILGKVYIETDFGRGEIEKRYCLGIGHPNALHCMIWLLVLLGIYLYHDRMKRYHYVMLFVGNIGLYMLTTSKTGILITAFTVAVAFMLQYWKGLSNSTWFYNAGIVIFIAIVAFALATSSDLGQSSGPFGWMDQYLTGRIRYSHLLGGSFTWSLFSRPENTEFFDMGFMRLFYWYGVIPGTLYMITNVLQLWFYRKQRDAFAFLIMIAITIYTLVEAHAISVYIARNYVILLLVGNWSMILEVQAKQEYYAWNLLHIPQNLKIKKGN